MNGIRPVSILIAALGGEGGGVLADWIIAAATAQGFPVQSTSVPGVAQRTGATNYYLEVLPVARAALGGREPVLSLVPFPGDVTLVAATELVEAGRMLQAGYVSPERTLLVGSAHREYAVSEKAAMGDGRYRTERIVASARTLAREAILFDMAVLAARHRTVINTVLFGAMAGSGGLPFSRAACEDAIRATGKAVAASLAGFAAGFDAVSAARARNDVAAESPVEPPPQPGAGLPHAAVPMAADALAGPSAGPAADEPPPGPRGARVAGLPPALRAIAAQGVAQVLDYQDLDYADRYLDRVESVLGAEQAHGEPDLPVTLAVARWLALWMSYEDVIRVADLKTRRDRLARVRREAGAADDEPMHLTEFLKPGLDELCSVLPGALARRVRRRWGARGGQGGVPLHLRTSTVSGFALLCVLRGLRRWRPRTERYAREHALMTRWLDAVRGLLARDAAAALELARCGNLVKGYGETSERGHRNLTAILDDVAARAEGSEPLAARIARARDAALADPQGQTLARALDLPPPALVEQPLRFVRRPAPG